MVQPIELNRELKRLGIKPDELRIALYSITHARAKMKRKDPKTHVDMKAQALAFTVVALELRQALKGVSRRELSRVARDLLETPF